MGTVMLTLLYRLKIHLIPNSHIFFYGCTRISRIVCRTTALWLMKVWHTSWVVPKFKPILFGLERCRVSMLLIKTMKWLLSHYVARNEIFEHADRWLEKETCNRSCDQTWHELHRHHYKHMFWFGSKTMDSNGTVQHGSFQGLELHRIKRPSRPGLEALVHNL